MLEVSGASPAVRLPERIDRRARLGPFPSAREAARFLCYAAAGALLAPFVSPFLWLPLVAVGFLVSVWQPEGRSADAKALLYLLWRVRSFYPRGAMSRPAAGVPRRGVVSVAPGTFAAIVRCGGCPIAYLPPAELELRFSQYREILRGLSGTVGIVGTTVPIRAADVRPRGNPSAGPERDAQVGYAGLVEQLCRRRRVRRVYLAIRNATLGPDSISRLEVEARTLAESLNGLGLHATRLTGPSLAEASGQLHWARIGKAG